jgi:integrase
VRAIYPYAKGKPLDEIVEVAESVKRSGQAAGLRPATINRRLAILRRVARLAHRRWTPAWLERDLGARIVLLPGEEPRYVQATPEQAERLIRSATGRTRKAILWATLTGLRAGELRAVQPHHFKNCSLVITRTKTGKPRLVPLQARLRAQDFPYGLTPDDTGRSFREARSKAGMPWLQFRDLRRTFGSWIVQKTHSLKAAQELLGHTTIAITAKHYAHLLEGDLRRAVRTLPDLAGQARGRRKKKTCA